MSHIQYILSQRVILWQQKLMICSSASAEPCMIKSPQCMCAHVCLSVCYAGAVSVSVSVCVRTEAVLRVATTQLPYISLKGRLSLWVMRGQLHAV